MCTAAILKGDGDTEERDLLQDAEKTAFDNEIIFLNNGEEL